MRHIALKIKIYAKYYRLLHKESFMIYNKNDFIYDVNHKMRVYFHKD